MDLPNVQRYFQRIEAQLKLRRANLGPSRFGGPAAFRLGIEGRGRDEHFLLTLSLREPEPDFQVLQANAPARHLLLLVREGRGRRREDQRFLCGHDERHWFVANVSGPVSTITEARRLLLPPQLREQSYSADDLARRRNADWVRQGEWFFVPSDRDLTGRVVHHQEPLVRPGGGKPHLCAELVRFGGERVWLARGNEYSRLEDVPAEQQRLARMMVKNPEVYVRGAVRHPDHSTVTLCGWHRVWVNGELRSQSLGFYD